MYEIAGLGPANPIEVGVTLQTLKDEVEASSDTEPFWMILPALEKPTDTFVAILKWAELQNVYYEMVTDGDVDEAKAAYPEAEEIHQAKHVYNKLFQLLEGRIAPGEDKALLVLDDEDNEDIDLLLLINKCIETNVPCYSLGGQMARIILEDDPEPTAAEDHTAALEAEEAELTPGQQALIDTGLGERMEAAAAKAAHPVEHDENPTQGPAPAYTPSEIDDTPLTRDDLKDFAMPLLKQMVKDRNVVARDMRSRESIIDALTGTTAPPKPQMPEPEVPRHKDVAEEAEDYLKEQVAEAQGEAELALQDAADEAAAKIADDHPTTAWKDREPTDEANVGQETEEHKLFKTYTMPELLGEAQEKMLDDIEHRFTNHPPTDAEVSSRLDAITGTMIDTANVLCAMVPESRERSLMLTKLEEVSFWAKAAVARNQA